MFFLLENKILFLVIPLRKPNLKKCGSFLNGKVHLYYKRLFGDNGVCVFGALTLVGALFILGEIIQMRTTKKQSIITVAGNVRSEQMEKIYLAQAHLWVAEKKLFNSLTDEQKILYQDYVEKRDAFYRLTGVISEKNVSKEKKK